MNEEEKRAVDELNSFINIPSYVFLNEYELLMQSTKIVLNLIERLRKENEELTISNKEIDKECSRLEEKEVKLINENEQYKRVLKENEKKDELIERMKNIY